MKKLAIFGLLASFSGTKAFVYQYDDGTSESALTTSGPAFYNAVFLTQYTVQPGGEILNSVDVVWGSRLIPNLPNGLSAEIWVILDTGGVGDPTGGNLVRQVSATTQNVGTDTFNSYAIAPLTLPVGTVFYVGAWIQNIPNGSTWVAIDTDATGRATQNWWYPTVDQHAGTTYLPLSIFNWPNNAATFMARANATPIPEPATLLALGAGCLTFLRRRVKR